MYNFGGVYYIDLAQVYCVEKFRSVDQQHPYGLRICFVNGTTKALNYADEASREREIRSMKVAKENVQQMAYNATMDQIRTTVRNEMQLARNDIRLIKKMLKGEQNGLNNQ